MNSKRRMPAEDNSSKRQAGASHEQCLLIQDEIWRVVADAERSGGSICATTAVQKIEGAFASSGLSGRDIADALIYAAVDAGVAVVRRPSVPRQTAVECLPRFSFAALRGRPPAGDMAVPPRATAPLEARP
jgi:hypothetical protein